ncbi:MAG: (2Fe-2S)-binding protein [Alphaproteobacteria bacterium]|nr:(2Fe-2S)-binding protein [Alphaproteobacteria bacterium]
MKLVTLTINGLEHSRAITPNMTLLEYLRDELNLTGTKNGCDSGECGCCSVMIDGKPMLSCIMLAIEAEGCKITTIEGIADGNILHPLQEAMVEEGAVQCGYCTPAMVINGVHLLDNNDSPTENEVKECISATLCRCTGYNSIERAVHSAARKMKEASHG